MFNQTLGFNKLEDDMNGSRLQQLTGIAANHANETVRDLKLLNVLVTRKGHYGNYLAINFDLAQWGQKDEQLTPTIDPCCLLPEDTVSDTGLDLSVAINQTDEVTTDDVEVSIDVHCEKPVKQGDERNEVNDEKAIKALLDALTTLTEKVGQLDKKIEKLQDNQQSLQEQQQEQQSQLQQLLSTTVTTTPSASTVTTAAETSTPVASTLRYPSSFNPQQCQQASSIIQGANDADKAQLLLDMLAKRLNHQHDPLRNPMRYLETLVNKLNANQLGITTATTSTTPSKSTETPYQTQTVKKPFVSTTTSITGEATPEPSKEELVKAEYQEATLDCQQMERNVNILAERENISFEQSLVKLGLQPWWEKAKVRVNKAKEAFVLLMEEQGQTVAV